MDDDFRRRRDGKYGPARKPSPKNGPSEESHVDDKSRRLSAMWSAWAIGAVFGGAMTFAAISVRDGQYAPAAIAWLVISGAALANMLRT